MDREACVEQLEEAGYPCTAATGGAVFVAPEMYVAALEAAGAPRSRNIVVTPLSAYDIEASSSLTLPPLEMRASTVSRFELSKQTGRFESSSPGIARL